MKTKIIPFNAKIAKDIQAGKIEGKIIRNGCEVIILDYNSKKHPGYPIRITYLNKDEVDYVMLEGLHIEVSDNEPQFKPFDKVLVRELTDSRTNNSITFNWLPAFFQRLYIDTDLVESRQIMYVANNLKWRYCIPYEGNEHLVGTR